MNKHEQPMGVDPKIKKEINEEGFEGDAAVLIGKKEDMPRMLEKLESGGKTEDLGTYIKLHKEILLPITELPKKIALEGGTLTQEFMKEIKGDAYFIYKEQELMYVDRDGNFCKVKINPQEIAQLRLQKLSAINQQRIEGLGFNLSHNRLSPNVWGEINQYIAQYTYKLEQEVEKSNKENFDF